MRSSTLALTGLAAALAVASCAPTTGGDGAEAPAAANARQCFTVNQVTNFRQGRQQEIYLRINRNDVYELSSAGGCRDLNFAVQMALVPDFGGSVGSRVCTGDWARIVVPGSVTPAEVCRVRVVRKLTPEQIEALPNDSRP